MQEGRGIAGKVSIIGTFIPEPCRLGAGFEEEASICSTILIARPDCYMITNMGGEERIGAEQYCTRHLSRPDLALVLRGLWAEA